MASHRPLIVLSQRPFSFFSRLPSIDTSMSVTSVQRAHDELLAAKPQGASHDDCPLCHPGAGSMETTKEVAVAEGDRTFTEAQHFALLTDAVARETANLSTAKEELESKNAALETEKVELSATNTDLQSRIDVVEAEKAAAEQARDTVQAEFDAYKAAETEKAEVEARKADRLSQIKAANSALGEDYFTEARTQRWAEMSDETFTALVADITEAAAAMGMHKYDAGEDGSCKACSKPQTAGAHFPVAKEKSAEDLDKDGRETAAFTGGTTPTAGSGSSLFGQFMQKTGHAPASV